ncbi:MAG: DNA-binding protein [Tissierellia bacterium]|nr:DNA-binding protein [Tissierellia bacterium]
MEYKKFGDKYVIRLAVGDEIIESITEFAKKENIKLAEVSAIGAVDKATIGFYSLEEQKYHATDLEGEFELLSLKGNITEKEGEPYIHLHIILSGEDLIARGGHLNAARISATCEIFVHVLDGKVGRKNCKQTGLNIFDFEV